MNPVSWRAAYTGMVRAVASWSVEIGWWGQKEWRKEMSLLQNAAMQKTLGVVKGTSGRKANAIAAVEDVQTFAKAAASRFLALTMCDPVTGGIRQVDETLAAAGELSPVGCGWRRDVNVVDLGPCWTSTAKQWEKAIWRTAGEGLVVYTDGSMDQDGRVGGGWYAK